MDKRAFSFVEIIISISILVVLTIVATTATNNIKNNSNNSRVIADITTLKNGVISYVNEGNNVPKPGGNNNFFNYEGNYVHEYNDSETLGAYGKITENTLDNRYLNTIPLDPRTNQYYSFGVAKESNQFEIAGVIFNEEGHRAKVEGNYTGEAGIYNLIGEYNGNNFVMDKGPFLPYDPEAKLLTVKDENGNIYRQGDTVTNNSGNDLELYFSDGSTSIISSGSKIILSQMDFPNETNLVSKIKVFLDAGSIWTQATSLGEESSFDIFTTDTVASVRGTVFGVNNTSGQTEVVVEQGTVDVYKLIEIIEEQETTQPDIIDKIEEVKTLTIYQSETIEIINDGEIKRLINDGPLQIDIVPSISKPAFSNKSSIININYTESETKINNKIESESCYLELAEIKNGDKRKAYKNKFSNNCDEEYIERTCENGELLGDNTYKYSSCRTDTTCPNFYTASSDDGIYDVGGLNLKRGDSTEINSIGHGITNGYLKHIGKITCKSNNQYTFSYKEHTVSCASGYKSEENQVTGVKQCVLDCDGITINGECVQNNLGGDWILDAAAEYNSNKGLTRISGSTVRKEESSINGNTASLPDYCSNGSDKSKSFCNVNGTKGYFIDNLNSAPDYIKYGKGVINDDDYAVEISVKGSDLKRNDGKIYYLFSTEQDSNNNLGIFYSNNKLFAVNNSTNSQPFTIPSDIEDNEFYSIILKVDDDEATVELVAEGGGANRTINLDGSFDLFNLYVGSSINKDNQWNGMINYIRVYKEND